MINIKVKKALKKIKHDQTEKNLKIEAITVFS